MVTSIVLIALIGTLQFNSAISAAINYEPIKITVNENFNTQPGQVSSELQEPGVLHQGANFYFKPQLNLPPSYIPSHIEALISLIQQHDHSCMKDTSKVAVEQDKLIEILKPFMYPLSDISKETLLKIVLEKENNLEIVKPIIITEEPKSVSPELLVISEAPVLPPSSFNGGIPSVVEEEVIKEESVILEEPTGMFPTIPEIAVRPIEEPIINDVEPKPITSEFVVVPEAPVLPPLTFNRFPSVVEGEVKKEESIILEESMGVFPTITEVAAGPITEPIIHYGEPKPTISGLVVIPEAPTLPKLTLNDISSIIEEEVKMEESIMLEEPTGVFPTLPEIAMRPIEEPRINYVEPKPITSELVVIPKAPVLPQLTLNDISSIIEEEVKMEESIILEEPTGVFPTLPEIAMRPIEEPRINYVEPKPITSELVVIPEARVLPQLTLNDISSIIEEEEKMEESIILEEPTGVFPTIPEIAMRPINYVEPKPITSEFVVIPEAPVLPSLTLNDISSIIEEEVKMEESIILEEPTGVFPTLPEIAMRPIEEPRINYVEPKPITSELVVIPEARVLPQLTLNDISSIIEEEEKMEESIILEEPTGVFPTIPEIAMRPINYVEPKPITSEFVVIPEAPVLPSLTLNDISSIIEEEVKMEESIILEEPTGVFPTLPEIAMRPIEEPRINYVEPKPITSELVVIPEARVLPQLTLNDISSIIEEEEKMEESIILEEPTGVFPTIPEIAMRPINYVEPKPITSEFVFIPETPVLPPLTLNDISSIIEEEVKMEESIILEEPTGVFPTLPEIAMRPIEEPRINYVEPKPITSELVVIPEAPVLPQLTLNDISSIIEEEVKMEESIILEEPTGVFPTIPKIAMRPIEEPRINYIEPKPITSELVVIPEAPVLPQLTLNDISSIIEEEVKMEESIILEEPTGVFPTLPEIAMRPIEEPRINYVEPKPITSELVVIPEAPVLPQLTLNDISSIIEEEVKMEESIILEEPTGVFPTIPKIAMRPIEEPRINYVEPKPITSELVVIPEAPVLPSLTLNDISSIIEEEVKMEESIILEEPTGVFPKIPKIAMRPIEEPRINYVEPKPITSELVVIPEAPVLPQLTLNDISSIIEEEVKMEESIILEEPTGVFPTLPEIAMRPIEEPRINYVEPKPITSELVVIPEARVLPQLTLNDISSIIEEEEKMEESIILEEPTGVFPTIPEIAMRPINYVEPKPITSELVVIPEAPLLPPLSYNCISPIVEEVKIEESIKVEESTGEFLSVPEISAIPLPEPLENKKLTETAESFALENNIFPVVTEEVKIEIPILLQESIEVFPPIAEISLGRTLQEFSPEITESYVLEEVSQPNPESVLTAKDTLPPTTIPKPSNHLGVFSYVPFVSHLSYNGAPMTKKLMVPKPASLERFLLKKHQFRLPVTPYPKLDLNAIKSSIWGNKKQLLYPTYYAHDVIEKRIAPNMAFKKQNAPKRVKIYIRSNMPKGPSYT